MAFRMTKIFKYLAILPLIATAASYNHKKQDADYVKEWCTRNGGLTEQYVSASSRVDCVTKNEVVEIEFADKYSEGIPQVARYAKESGKKGRLVLVVENPYENHYVDDARALVKAANPNINIEILTNFKSKKESLAEIGGPAVKMARRSGICHVKNKGSYGVTKKFVAYNSLEACIKAGGKRPKNAKI